MPARICNLLYQLNPTVKLWLGRILGKLGCADWIIFPQRGYWLRLYPETEHRWLQSLDSPRPVENFFWRYLKTGDLAIDAGANVGVFSIVAATQVGLTGKVYAIEPHPRTFESLQRHIADNKATNVTALQLALGKEPGTVTFSDEVLNSDLNHVASAEESTGRGIIVPMQCLDGLGIDEKPVNLLKIDVEGYELDVLRGASQLLQRVNCILFEVEEAKCKRYGYDSLSLLDFVRSQGFHILRIVGEESAEMPQDYKSVHPEDIVAVRDMDDFFMRTKYSKVASIAAHIPSLRGHRLSGSASG